LLCPDRAFIVHTQPLTIKQTATGYWIVERGRVALSGAMTRAAAEAERDMLNALRVRTVRRTRRRPARVPGTRSAAARR
jgi:hypothetical protein